MSMMFISISTKKEESGKNKCNKKHTETIKNSRTVLAFDFCFVYCEKLRTVKDYVARFFGTLFWPRNNYFLLLAIY